MWECVPQCGRVCPVCEGVPKSRRVCPSVGTPKVFPSVRGCSLAWDGVGGSDTYVYYHGIS